MLKRFKQCWQSESPLIYKRITNTCAFLIGGSTIVLALSQVPGIQLPDAVFKYTSYVLLGATVVGLPSKLTVKKD